MNFTVLHWLGNGEGPVAEKEQKLENVVIPVEKNSTGFHTAKENVLKGAADSKADNVVTVSVFADGRPCIVASSFSTPETIQALADALVRIGELRE